MKNNWTLVLFVMGAFVLASCSQSGSSSAIDSAPNEAVAVGETPAAIDEISADEALPSDAPAGGTALLSDTSSGCYNPFFPVSEDASWTFRYDTGLTYMQTMDVTNEDTFTVTQTFNNDDLVSSINYFCTEEGILQEFTQIVNEMGEDATTEVNLTMTDWTGHTLPNPDEMDVGSTWTATYTLAGDITVGGLVTTAEGTVTIIYVVSAIEEVTVPAGTFPQAYRVDSTTESEIEIVLNMMGEETIIPSSVETYHASAWYVEDLGVIKFIDTLEGGSASIELVGSSLIN